QTDLRVMGSGLRRRIVWPRHLVDFKLSEIVRSGLQYFTRIGVASNAGFRSWCRLARPSVTMRPEGAGRADAAVWVVDTLFVRTTENPINSGYRSRPLSANELDDLPIDDGVEPDISVH